MAFDAQEIVVGGSGSIHVAPTGTTLPATVDTSLDPAFVDLGYTSEDGVTFNSERTSEPVDVWQSYDPVRYILTGRMSQASFSLAQWNTDTVIFGFGGGAVTEPTNDFFTYTPADPEDGIDERAMVIKFQDGARHFAIAISRGMVTGATETQITKAAPGMLPITFSVMADGVNPPWAFLSNDDDAFVLGS